MSSFRIEDVEKLHLDLKDSEHSEHPFLKELFKGFKKVRKKLISIAKIDLMKEEERKISDDQLKVYSEKKIYENEFNFYQQTYNMFIESKKVDANSKEKDSLMKNKLEKKSTKSKKSKNAKEDSDENSIPIIYSNDDDLNLNSMLKNLARFFLIQNIDENLQEKAILPQENSPKLIPLSEIKENAKRLISFNFSGKNQIKYSDLEEKLMTNLKEIMLSTPNKIDSNCKIDFNSLNLAINRSLNTKFKIDSTNKVDVSNSIPQNVNKEKIVKIKSKKKKNISTGINTDQETINANKSNNSKEKQYKQKSELIEEEKFVNDDKEDDSDAMSDLNRKIEEIEHQPIFEETNKEFSDDEIPQLRNGGKIYKNIDKIYKGSKTWNRVRCKGGYGDI